jgi:hypothetical protein
MRDSPRWLRIHSLPDSKRYPESEAEYDEMLRRQNAVAQTVLGSPSDCLLIVWRIAREFDPVDWDAEGQSIGVALSPTNAWGRLEDEDNPPAFYEFAVAHVVWALHAFDALIRAVADERQYGLLFFSGVTHQAYAPYDGGADLFVATTQRRDELRALWADWLSERDDGL